MEVKVHVHQFEEQEVKIQLYNWRIIQGEWNNILSGHDLIQMKVCKCGRKEAYGKVKRVKV